MQDAKHNPPVEPANSPILAFVNSVVEGDRMRATDAFEDGAGLLALLQSGGLQTHVDPPGSGQLQRLRLFREACYGMLSAIAAGRAPRREDTLVVETAIKSATSDGMLAWSDGVPRWTPGPMGGLQDALALEFDGFLKSADLTRLRECKGCTELFLDHGRGPGRKWCSMARCGNRAKAQGFRDRRRAAG